MRLYSTLKQIIKLLSIAFISLTVFQYINTGNIHSFEYVLSGFNLKNQVYLSLSDVVIRRGYSWREYSVVTDDGYILTMQRIGGNATFRSHPVYIQHGVLSSSVDWLVGSSEGCLACVLADEGFDVWLGNIRGNTYSHSHTDLSPNDELFWNFSFNEHAQFDITAMVSFVVQTTKKDKLIFVGHSQGALIGLIQLSRDHKFADQIALFATLAPTVSFRGVRCPLVSLSPYYRHYYNLIGKKWFMGWTSIGSRFAGRTVCANRLTRRLCLYLIGFFNGFNIDNIDTDVLPLYLQFQPSPTSVKNMVHYAQVIMGGELRHYDHMSEEENLKFYNQTSPPLYDVSNIMTPVIIVASEDDLLCPANNVRELNAVLPNVVESIWLKDFAHLDFALGRDVVAKVYRPLVSAIEKHL